MKPNRLHCQPQRGEPTVGAKEMQGPPATDTNANTNGRTWRGSGLAGNAECRPTGHSGTGRRRGIDR